MDCCCLQCVPNRVDFTVIVYKLQLHHWILTSRWYWYLFSNGTWPSDQKGFPFHCNKLQCCAIAARAPLDPWLRRHKNIHFSVKQNLSAAADRLLHARPSVRPSLGNQLPLQGVYGWRQTFPLTAPINQAIGPEDWLTAMPALQHSVESRRPWDALSDSKSAYSQPIYDMDVARIWRWYRNTDQRLSYGWTGWSSGRGNVVTGRRRSNNLGGAQCDANLDGCTDR